MATSKPIVGNKQNDIDGSFYEKNSPRSSTSSIDELTKRTLQAGDHADSGLHINSMHNSDWLNEHPFHNEDKTKNNTTATTENDDLLIKQHDFWMTDKCSACVKKIFKPCLRSEEDPLPVTALEKVKYALLCPPAGPVADVLLRIILLVALWSVLWAISGASAEPGGNLFALFILWIVAAALGAILELCKLPGLLGMLIAGFVLKNVPGVEIAQDIHPKWSTTIRGVALVVILIRAGLGLDPRALKKLSCVCVRLAFLPCLSEAVVVMVVSHLILNLPWLWGLMLGFVLAAVSPAVVVPCLISLQERKYGTAKGIPTLVIASASIDDVLAIGGFGVVLAITFSTGNLTMTVLQGPIEVVIGVVYGCVVGLLLWFLPNKSNPYIVGLRSSLVFFTGVFAVLGSRVFDFAGFGPLACLILSFIAAIRWREDDESCLESIKHIYAFLWFVFQPFLFALIGAEISISSLDLNVIGYGFATLACGLTVRVLVSYLSVLGAGFNWKERVFVALAWLPKATVQAAIGPVALDYARTKGHGDNSAEIGFGIQILAIAVLAIMITAPIGAALIVLSGPRLLSREMEENKNNRDPDSVNTQL